MRLAGLLRDDFRMLELARRARGVADRGRLRRFLGLAFAVLVLSIRRGTRARDRDGGAWFRRTQLAKPCPGVPADRADGILVLVAVLVGGIAVAVAVATGWWHPVIG